MTVKASWFFFSYFDEKEEINSSSSESEGETKNVANSLERIQGLQHFRASALFMSLVSIVSVHNGSDELLHDLLKRDQVLFSNQSFSPWSVRNFLRDECSKYQHPKIVQEG